MRLRRERIRLGNIPIFGSGQRCERMYCLPKIHKLDKQSLDVPIKGLCSIRQISPGQPFISYSDIPKDDILCHYCDHLLRIVRKQFTYIRDASDIIQNQTTESTERQKHV